MRVIARQLESQYTDSNRGQGASVLPLSEVIREMLFPILLVLLGGAGLLLAIACVNMASLLLVRSQTRRREIAVREALGASTGRSHRSIHDRGFSAGCRRQHSWIGQRRVGHASPGRVGSRGDDCADAIPERNLT